MDRSMRAAWQPGLETTALGDVAERLKALVLKTSRPKGLEGSNPSVSARTILYRRTRIAMSIG